MARKPRHGQDSAAPGQPAGGGIVSVTANTSQPPELSQTGEEAVRQLARLVGRQIARGQFNDDRTARPGYPPKDKKT